MFPPQLTGWTDAARAAARQQVRPTDIDHDEAESESQPRLPAILSAGWLGTVAGLAACMAIGLAAWMHVNL